MGVLVRGAIRACLLCLTTAAAAQRLSPTIDITTIRLEIIWVENATELARVRSRYERPVASVREGALPDARRRVHGFSILRKRADGYTCELYAVKPETVNDSATATLGHELLHCLLGAYHE